MAPSYCLNSSPLTVASMPPAMVISCYCLAARLYRNRMPSCQTDFIRCALHLSKAIISDRDDNLCIHLDAGLPLLYSGNVTHGPANRCSEPSYAR